MEIILSLFICCLTLMCVLFHLIDAQSQDHRDFCGKITDCGDCLKASNVNYFNVLHVYVCM